MALCIKVPCEFYILTDIYFFLTNGTNSPLIKGDIKSNKDMLD